ncbi:hypothetical protein [Acetivibrio saccincola]|jgi:hypothetical protein|uniref:Uncharacterized protein n=1 Tax=Acetivibrio saccincola TaxID=1677857 RepID=A0A2K9EK78_9FIRM|nr:hypothetical protein [Acetivibrio saccincola]AUG56961.1 hypothetical protein HVS_05140 [Acetivibrio saccincola]NLW25952.1 hypothetical protein [Acetivibrio saccincola]PQQ66984.1 hypothetical protein B9R14_09695 [Acetivibrio saccincola]HOA97810.1 hypothetical protein [Acetivibrio saccincola]HQD29297.1 hypothetical protein [Acetivibrio saccincola]
MYCGNFGFGQQNEFPDNIKKLLKLLKGEKVIIVLRSGCKQTVCVEAVVGNLLMASVNRSVIKFVDIDCICEVLAESGDVLSSIFMHNKGKRPRVDFGCDALEECTKGYGWQVNQNNQPL